MVVLKLRGGVPPLRRGTAGGPVCRPYKGERSLISNSVRETVRVAPTSTCLNPGGRVRTPAPTACREAVPSFVGAGPRAARGRGMPLPYGFQGHSFRVWVGEPLGAPAVDDSGQKVTLIRPLRGHLLPRRKKARAADSRPYGRYRNCLFFRRGRTLAGPQMYAARPGGRALQPSTSYHLLSKARRRYKIAVAIIFANPGPSGPAGI